MLGRGNVGLSHADVVPQLVKGHIADPHDEAQGHEPMSPIPPVLCRPDVPPRKLVQTLDIAVAIARMCVSPMGSPTSMRVQGKEYWEQQACRRDEDLEKSAEVSQEEVCIETTLLDELGVGSGKN